MLLKLFKIKSPKSFRGLAAKQFVDDFNRIFEFSDGVVVDEEGFGRSTLRVYIAASASSPLPIVANDKKRITDEMVGEFYRFMHRWGMLYGNCGKLDGKPMDYNAKLIGLNDQWYIVPRMVDAKDFRRYAEFTLIQIPKKIR